MKRCRKAGADIHMPAASIARPLPRSFSGPPAVCAHRNCPVWSYLARKISSSPAPINRFPSMVNVCVNVPMTYILPSWSATTWLALPKSGSVPFCAHCHVGDWAWHKIDTKCKAVNRKFAWSNTKRDSNLNINEYNNIYSKKFLFLELKFMFETNCLTDMQVYTHWQVWMLMSSYLSIGHYNSFYVEVLTVIKT